MAHLTPTERLEWLLKQSEFATAAQTINAIIKNYQIFLESMDKSDR